MYDGITTRWRPKAVEPIGWYRKGKRQGWLAIVIALGLVIIGVAFYDINHASEIKTPVEVAR